MLTFIPGVTCERDRAAGRTLDGPHRSDLIVGHGPKQMPARLSSTGEQKSLLLGLILATLSFSSSATMALPRCCRLTRSRLISTKTGGLRCSLKSFA